jgi:hypothetical protein
MPLRVLALCGFTQNAHIYSKQVRDPPHLTPAETGPALTCTPSSSVRSGKHAKKWNLVSRVESLALIFIHRPVRIAVG